MTLNEMYSKLLELGYTELESPAIVRELRDNYETFATGSVDIILNHFPHNGDYVGFNGWNCEDARYSDDDPCLGWDGYSRRCQCGNRRVSWVVEGSWAYGDAD